MRRPSLFLILLICRLRTVCAVCFPLSIHKAILSFPIRHRSVLSLMRFFFVKSSTTQMVIQDVAVTNRDPETRAASGRHECTNSILSKIARAFIRSQPSWAWLRYSSRGWTNRNGPSADPHSPMKSTDAVERDPSVVKEFVLAEKRRRIFKGACRICSLLYHQPPGLRPQLRKR